jgi:steroid delta-isomerase-like uncharacterized protein
MSTTQSSPAELEQLARDYFAAVAARDISGMERLWGPEPVWDVTPLGERLDREQARGFFAELFAALPDLETTTEQLTVGERVTALQWRMAGTFDGRPFTGIAPTGRRIEVRGCDCLEWEDGKLVKNTVYYDGLTFARGAGMLPAIGSAGERGMFAAFNALTAVRRRIPPRS